VTLPSTIAKLKNVTQMHVQNSSLVRIPREIGEMTSLETFRAYKSWCLHWLPYEITQCRQLHLSDYSVGALYGNPKYRMRFASLASTIAVQRGPIRPCSVCDQLYEDLELHRVWLTLLVATDDVPLLVNACSATCIATLPAPAHRYPGPHRGGLHVGLPPRRRV